MRDTIHAGYAAGGYQSLDSRRHHPGAVPPFGPLTVPAWTCVSVIALGTEGPYREWKA